MARRSLSNAGLGLAIVSGAAFGTSGSFATSLIRAGWSPGAAVVSRVVVAAVVLTVPALLRLRAYRLTAKGARSIACYGVVAVGGAQLCYFNAVEHLSVAVALLIEYSGIVLVMAWMWIRHEHRPTRLTVAGAATALLGLVLVLDLLSSHRVDAVGALWGLGAAVGLAVYFVASSSTDEAPPALVVAWGGLAVASAVLGAAIGTGALRAHAVGGDVTLAHQHVSWLVPVLGMSIVAAVVAYATGIAAARLLGATVASLVGLTEVLFAVVFAWLLLGQHLDVVQGAGAVLVLGGISLVRLDGLRQPAGVLIRPDATGETPPVTLTDTALPATAVTLPDSRDGRPICAPCLISYADVPSAATSPDATR
jgi:drug/metabolite transporter (DMT)-like permease